MIYRNLEDTFCCSGCGKTMKEYYRSNNDTDLCIYCDTSDDYDDGGDYYEDDSDSPWNE